MKENQLLTEFIKGFLSPSSTNQLMKCTHFAGPDYICQDSLKGHLAPENIFTLHSEKSSGIYPYYLLNVINIGH